MDKSKFVAVSNSLIKGLLLGLILFGTFDALGYYNSYLRKNFWDNPKLIYGYHLHHSLLGLFGIIWGIYCLIKKSPKAYFWIGLGLGIIITHTISGGKLVFIE